MPDTPAPTPDAVSDKDSLTRFVLEQSGVRGVLVRLDQTWEDILGRTDYPSQVADVLGECCAAAALFTGHTKVDGRLSIQLSGSGPVRTLFAECTHAGTLRGIAHFTPPVPERIDLRQLDTGAVLAITIESRPPGAPDPIRYQGLVGLDADSLAEAFEGYFRQSEQLATRILLARRQDSVCALMIQQLPGDQGDPDGWRRCSTLLDTLTGDELAATPNHTLLYRLFHEEGVRMLGQRPLRFACSCSRARVADVLVSLGREEADAAAADGSARVDCEFCNAHYEFSRAEIAALFTADAPAGRLH